MQTLRKTMHLIGRANRLRLAVLIPLAVIVTVAEMVGAGLIYALLSLATGSADGFELPLVGDVGGLLGSDTDSRTLLLGLAAGMAVFFLVRSGLKVTQSYVESRIVLNMAARLSTRMMVGYLMLPYSVHLRRRSSELIRNTNQAIEEIFSDIIKPTVKLVAEVMLTVGMLVVLVAVSPLGTVLATVVLGGVAVLLLLVVQPRLRRLGARRHRLNMETLQTLQHAFHGIRDVKVLGAEQTFGRRYGRDRKRMARIGYIRSTIGEFPTMTIELALVGFILLFFVATISFGDNDPSDTLAVLGLFAYAGQRLQGAVQKIISALNKLVFGAAPIEELSRDLRLMEDQERATERVTPIPFSDRIRLEDVSFRYEGAHRNALDGITLEIRRGEVFGLCGPTGGGKTTLVDVLTGLLTPTKGRVTVDGCDVAEHVRAWQRNLGVVPQMVFVMDATMRENIALAEPSDDIDEDAVQEAVDLAQLREFVDSLPEGLDTIVGERGVRISGGQRQRVAIARALYRRPTVLVFDEGTSALDNATEREIMLALERLRGEHTIILVAHRLSTVRNANRISYVEDARILASGSYEDLMASSPQFANLAAT